MKTKTLLLLATLTTTLSAEPAKTIQIIAYDTMKFNVTKIEAHPGQRVTVELKSEGVVPKNVMAHNWILLKAGEDPIAYANAAISAKSENYEPKSLAGKVLASIPQLGPKEVARTSFTAPTKPGNYAYVCSFPAHAMAGMRGVLVVR
jgi:azurin